MKQTTSFKLHSSRVTSETWSGWTCCLFTKWVDTNGTNWALITNWRIRSPLLTSWSSGLAASFVLKDLKRIEGYNLMRKQLTRHFLFFVLLLGSIQYAAAQAKKPNIVILATGGTIAGA